MGHLGRLSKCYIGKGAKILLCEIKSSLPSAWQDHFVAEWQYFKRKLDKNTQASMKVAHN